MNLKIDLNKLVQQNILTPEKADEIRDFYRDDKPKEASANRILLAFGIIGGLLIGLGIILLVAHNWDQMSVAFKLCLVFFLLIAAQSLCAYAIYKKGIVWKESTAVILFLVVGACIALVSQIYHIQGSLDSYLLTWMLLVVGLIYLVPSSGVSLLYLGGITAFTIATLDGPDSNMHLFYFLLLVLILPHYYDLFKTGTEKVFLNAHHWLVPISLLIIMFTIGEDNEHFLWLVYMSLLGLFILIGSTPHFKAMPKLRNSYRVIGVVGTLIILFILSFKEPWESIKRSDSLATSNFFSIEGLAFLVLMVATLFLLYQKRNKEDGLHKLEIMQCIPFIFPLLFVIGLYSDAGRILVNFLLLGIGIFYIRNGNEDKHLLFLNLGMIIISILIICRFMDMQISFVWRGIIFILLGIGFFIANYRILKKAEQDG